MNENIDDKFNANKISPTSYHRSKETIKTICNAPNTIVYKEVQKITAKDLKLFFSSITTYSNSTIDKIYNLLFITL